MNVHLETSRRSTTTATDLHVASIAPSLDPDTRDAVMRDQAFQNQAAVGQNAASIALSATQPELRGTAIKTETNLGTSVQSITGVTGVSIHEAAAEAGRTASSQVQQRLAGYVDAGTLQEVAHKAQDFAEHAAVGRGGEFQQNTRDLTTEKDPLAQSKTPQRQQQGQDLTQDSAMREEQRTAMQIPELTGRIPSDVFGQRFGNPLKTPLNNPAADAQPTAQDQKLENGVIAKASMPVAQAQTIAESTEDIIARMLSRPLSQTQPVAAAAGAETQRASALEQPAQALDVENEVATAPVVRGNRFKVTPERSILANSTHGRGTFIPRDDNEPTISFRAKAVALA